ncbi:MAG: response regulator [bacterium]|nr:response regulator [Candidatus Margulisiibacteriota bacterium]
MARKILIIDDEPDMVEMISMRLKAFNYETISAGNGEEGIKIANQQKPDLILLDLMMPVMDGYETCKQLKEDDKTKKIPIIILTAVGKADSVSRSMEIGAVDYISKPFEPKTLMEKIRKVLK